ncbi:MAG TPA: protein kinase, partial [Gammaproteobacteria bacterium]|nr:protein kinase [Gammaproteobacteria bacterium]
MKKFAYGDQKVCQQVQQPLQQEVKDLELKCDAQSVLFNFSQENKNSKEKIGFLNRRPIQIKADNLHEGVFWQSKKNRDIIKSKILKIKEEQALRRSARIKKGQMPIENQVLCAEGVLFPLQNEDTNKREVVYISRDFQAFIPPGIRLGQGQFGTVSLIQNALTGRWHCFKILNKNVVQDKEPEVLSVEGMLRVNETMPGGDTVLITELIHGKSLKDIIQEISKKKALIFAKTYALNSNMSVAKASESVLKESFSFEQALSLSMSLVEAYEGLQMKGYVHRDIKPDNIMFDQEQKKCFA